jgi:hypothetical protein
MPFDGVSYVVRTSRAFGNFWAGSAASMLESVSRFALISTPLRGVENKTNNAPLIIPIHQTPNTLATVPHSKTDAIMKPASTLLLTATLTLTACSWGIKLDSGGKNVRVAWNDDVSACRLVGAINVSVLDMVGPIDRNGLKVSDELEVMARNQAGSLPADTIKAVDKPHNGEQNWNAYVCGGRAKPPARTPSAKPADGVKTYPIKDQ